MDQSHINGADGFAFDDADWPQNMDVGQVEPAYYFDGDGSAPVGQQGYGIPTQSSTTYGQTQAHIGGYNPGFQPQSFHGLDQYQPFTQGSAIQHNTPLQNSHHVPTTAHLNGYPQPYDAGHSVSPVGSQAGYGAPRVASPYLPQPGGGNGVNRYNDSRPEFFNTAHTQQQHVPVQQQHAQIQQQHALVQQQRAQVQQQHAPVQQQRAQVQQQHASVQQQSAPVHQQRAPVQQQHVAAPVYQAQQVGQQLMTVPQQQLVQPAIQSSAARNVPTNPPSTAGQLAAHTPQQSQPGLSVPDMFLRATPTSVDPNSTNSQRWVGMNNAFISDTFERLRDQKQSDRLSNEKLLPVFARTDRRRLYSERPLLIPAEAMGRYIDSLRTIAKDDEKAGVKHRIRRLALEYDLQRVGSLDREALDSYDKVPKGGLSKFQAEARKRGIEYPPLEPEDSFSELELLEMRTVAMLDLPTTWALDTKLLKQVAADFAEFLAQAVKDLRNLPEYKELVLEIKKSKDKEETSQCKRLRPVLEKGRERLRRVVATALRVADDRILAVLEPRSVAHTFQVLVNLANTNDIESPLTNALLNFAGRLPFLDDSMVESFKWSKLVSKLEVVKDEEVKAAVRRIKDVVKSNEGKEPLMPKVSSTPAANGKAASKPSSAKVVPATSGNSATKGSTGASTSKRPRTDQDEGEGRVTKKPATELRASASQPSKNSSQRTTAPAQAQAKAAASTTILNALKARPSTGALPGKSRLPAKVATKSEAVKPERSYSEIKPSRITQSQLTSTSKPEVSKPPINNPSKTSSSEASKMSSQAQDEDTKPETSRSSSGFAALMSEIEQSETTKRPSPTPKKTEIPINETDEERQRRIRKEERRALNLRVAFKKDKELVAIREFHVEEAEDEDRDDHMILDANDDKAEGMLLKASRSSQIDTDREWEEPILIDFTTIPEEQRQKTFVTRGGHIEVETEQQKLMAEKEMTEVMVVYTDAADIPSSASSPRPETDIDFLGPSGTEMPEDENIAARAALTMAYGPRGSLEQLLKRNVPDTTSTAAMIVDKVKAAAPYQNYDDPQVRKVKDEQVFQALTSAAARNYVDPEPVNPELSKIRRDYDDPAVQAASKSLEAVFKDFTGQPARPQEPPKWQQDPVRRAEWIDGYNKDKLAEEATRQAAQQSALLAQNYGQQAPSQQQNAYAQFYQQQPAQDPMAAALAALQSATAQPAQAAQQPNPLHALMAAYGNQQAAPAVDPNQALQLAMWAAATAAQQPQAQQYGTTAQAGYGQDNNQQDEGAEHRNRDRDRGGRRGGREGGGREEDHLRGINRSLIGTKPCTFWARGNCNRGDKCTFRHG
ncbi:hypothetical protein CONLIGDRAFT_135920 [Coniochaeta ligniaria NRRL 30616]|uniref:C3H1-type domain-containing protein n=1 Tax=Coniochaeta ligniaria NRRL 30616 TaxID=1408157 RepID=A0A1J7IR72_9PEZI|nr:hypothetical protein CONLIGDRAFT_135920 [Coniochaeta ligniaria NRRL 30616]